MNSVDFLYIINIWFVLFKINMEFFQNEQIVKKMISKIPKEYYKDFIRGIFDADGSFTYYVLSNKNNYKKINVRFGATIELLDFIQNVLIENNISTEYFKKYSKRHPKRDGEYYQLAYSGTIQGEKILTWLYKDADIYLDRKYQKWIDKWNDIKES